MKKKTYKILSKIPLVNSLTSIFIRPSFIIYGSLAKQEGVYDTFMERLKRHPELKDEVITDKIVNKLLSEHE